MEQESFNIIGISVKTTNENCQSMKDLGKLWNNFYSENIISRIPDKLSDDIYSVYTDYKSDYKGEYTTVIGYKVKSLDSIPEGLTGKRIQAGKYFKYTAKGKMPDVVMGMWKELWSKDKELNRAYTSDFEVYGKKSQNPDNAEVDIYIATKE